MAVHPNLVGDSSLVLAPKQSRFLPLFVIFSKSGKVRTAMGPDTNDLISSSNLQNKSTSAPGDCLSIATVVD